MADDAPCTGGWRQRLFAGMLGRAGDAHDRLVAAQKRALLGALHGHVLEIGPGTGVNLRYYAPDIAWTGVEPNPYLHTYVRREAARLGRSVTLLDARAEALPLADGAFDAVVSTLVLCSVRDVSGALAEVWRVLRPGGAFVFVEHVAAPRGTLLRRAQRLIQPVWTLVADGCHPDRETWAAIESAGFAALDLHHFRLPVPIVGPHIAGRATR